MQTNGSKDHAAALLPILRCPDCITDLNLENENFFCSKCRTRYPFSNGVARFVVSEGYVSSFGFEWNEHGRTQLDDQNSHISEDAFRRSAGLTPQMIHGKWILDVGCGMGRFAEVASRWGGNVVGVDLSRAADKAASIIHAGYAADSVQENLVKSD